MLIFLDAAAVCPKRDHKRYTHHAKVREECTIAAVFELFFHAISLASDPD
jgi:hypothetical protein